MIRKVTLTSYDKWVQPTEEEIAEMIKLCGKTVDTISRQLGISSVTLQRWKRTGISYSDWALLAFMAGKGDIVRPENTEEDVEAKLESLAKVSYIYHKKLSDIVEKNKLKKILRKKAAKNLDVKNKGE